LSPSVYDYIVVGAGSAGCVLAARLSEDPSKNVLLLEAGPADRSIWIHLPIGYGKTMWSNTYNWRFNTAPEAGLNGRRIYWPRGKTLGGSSAINGLIYIRGQQQDFDHWAALGNFGWSYADVLPLFVRSEGNQSKGLPHHGQQGQMKVSDIGVKHPLIEAFISGAQTLGVPRNEDFNGSAQVGAGYYQLTTNGGLRCSTASAFLRPARKRVNLHIATNAQAARILFDEDRASGVRYRQEGVMKTAQCRGEVLLSAGAIQSPQLLQLSGIGPAALLARHGIPVRVDAPQVGENLQDHLQIRLGYQCTQPITTNDQLNSWWGKVKIGLQWLLFRTGPLAVGINQGGCFMQVLPQASDGAVADADVRPDIQFHVATLSADMAGGAVHPYSGFTLSVCQLRPESRGHIRIQSDDPFQAPEIVANYLSEELDRRTAVAAVKAARRIANSAPFRRYVEREVKPGPDAISDGQLLEFIRANAATIFHPVGTCRMGVDANAVVDPRLRVNGVKGLRVVDCSIMPTLVSGNTHAAAVMIGEKAAQMIRDDETFRLAASTSGTTPFVPAGETAQTLAT
jgi:choline dehydrogenase